MAKLLPIAHMACAGAGHWAPCDCLLQHNPINRLTKPPGEWLLRCWTLSAVSASAVALACAQLWSGCIAGLCLALVSILGLARAVSRWNGMGLAHMSATGTASLVPQSESTAALCKTCMCRTLYLVGASCFHMHGDAYDVVQNIAKWRASAERHYVQ